MAKSGVTGFCGPIGTREAGSRPAQNFGERVPLSSSLLVKAAISK